MCPRALVAKLWCFYKYQGLFISPRSPKGSKVHEEETFVKFSVLVPSWQKPLVLWKISGLYISPHLHYVSYSTTAFCNTNTTQSLSMNSSIRKRLRKIWHGFLEVRNAVAIIKSANYRYLRFVPPGHFYSPLPDHDEINRNAKTLFDRTAVSVTGIDLNEEFQYELCSRFAGFRKEITFSDEPSDGSRYHFNNPYFSYGDAVVLYSMMRSFRPERIIEIGSGFSSAAMLDTDEQFFEGNTRFTFIEPFPERLDELLTNQDKRKKQVLDKPVQQVPLSVFKELEKNDILFIDSSHVMKAGSDLSFLMFSVLPVLKPGVIIHFHDVLWPFEYPRKWFNNGRAWNEAYMLRTFLMHNPAYEILFFNSWLEEHHRSMLKRNLPLMLRKPASKITRSNSSLWMRKK